MSADGLTDLFHWQVDRAGRTPIFRQIYLQARSAILLRTFAPGTRLPSTRSLARRLRVARASVASAYEQLYAEGYLTGKIGSGTYVSSDLPEPIDPGPAKRTQRSPLATPRARIRRAVFHEFPESTIRSDDRPFNTGRTLVDARTVDIWRKLTNRTLRSFGPNHLGYSDPSGLIELRTAICQYLRVARAVRCDPDQIIVTTGTQHAIDIVIRIGLRPQDQVWVEDPGYPLISRALVAAGVKLCPIPVDAQGMNVAAAIKLAPAAIAAFVTPSHQFPLGVVLSMARRLELLAWARRTDAWIIEDDYASEYRYAGRPLASLQGLDDTERVIYVGTLNKTLFPGLRMGYAVVPRPLLQAFVSARYLMDRQPSTLQQMVLAEFMSQGYLAAHIRRMRLAYRDHRDLLVRELARRLGSSVSIVAPDQGMFIIASLKQGLSDIDIQQRAQENGVFVQAVSRLYKKARPSSALMLGFSGYPRQLIVPAVARLARAFRP
jgi:GntR family transcriptional regulator/MocR family aminotransferase